MPEQYDDMTPHARGAQENDGCAGEIGRGGSRRLQCLLERATR